MTGPTTFADFAGMGYRLVPIIPHDAPISEKSSLFGRVGTDQDGRGKTPGVRGGDGRWFSYDWIKTEAEERDLTRWQAIQAGIGIMTGELLLALDADTPDVKLAGQILMTTVKHFGVLPTRIGNAPKALYLIRLSAPMKYTRVEFGERDAKGRLKDRVECLSDGRQFVARGTHPKTKLPYTWTTPLLPFDQLPVFSPAQVVAYLEELRSFLPAAAPIVTEGSTNDVAQASLQGDLETVRKAVKATPNTSKTFGTREAYRDFGYAIKAALPQQEPEAFELFSEWAGRWEDGTNDPAIVAADWRRMKGPYRRGASWIYELAEQENPAAFKNVDRFFDVIPEETPLFNNESLQTPLKTEPVAIKWVDPASWEGTTPPVREWWVDGLVPNGEVTLLTGAGGVGKTLLLQLMATCIAMGLPFLGRPTKQAKVMLFLCEDSEDELQLRQRAICLSLGVTLDDVAPNLRIASRKFMDNLLASIDRNSGTMKRTAVWQALRDDAVAWGAKVTAVDTIADTFGGNEIDRSHVRQFVQSCLGKLAQDTGGATIALGHPSKAGQAPGGDGTSGSTAWHASVRSRLYLTHASKDGSGPYRQLTSMKANYGAGGDVFMLQWFSGSFRLVAAKSVSPDAVASAAAGGSEGLGALAVPSMGNAIDDALLSAVADLRGHAVPLSDAHNSPNWAPRVLRRRSEALGIYKMDDIEAGWLRVVKSGRVRPEQVGRKADRHPLMSYVLDIQPMSVEPESIFD